MNITEITNKIITIASDTPMVGSASYGDVYEQWNANNIHYGAVCVSYDGVSIVGPMLQMSAILYYGDRLTNSRDNETRCYDDGVIVLSSILNQMQDELDADVSDAVFTLFQQKFTDELAGCYARVNISIPFTLGGCTLNGLD